MDLPQASTTAAGLAAAPQVSPPSTVVDVPVGVMGGEPSTGDVSAIISTTMPQKRKRAATAATPAAAVTPPAAAKGNRVKTKAAGPRGAPPSKAAAKRPGPGSRVGLAPPPSKAAVTTPRPSVPATPSPAFTDADANNVFDDSSTSYMEMLNGSTVNLDDGIDDPFRVEEIEDDGDEEADDGNEEADDGNEVTEVEPPVVAEPGTCGQPKAKKPRKTSNYTEVEDVTLIRAWSKVGLDACTGTDQTGKRYWQRIEDQYHKLKPRTKSLADRSYRSLQGRWDTIKPCCSRWSAAMDQVADNPPSGCVPADYVSFLP